MSLLLYEKISMTINNDIISSIIKSTMKRWKVSAWEIISSKNVVALIIQSIAYKYR